MSQRILWRNERNAAIALLSIEFFCFLTLSSALAIEPVNKTPGGVAIKGYDPVAYFIDGQARGGIIKHSSMSGTAQYGILPVLSTRTFS